MAKFAKFAMRAAWLRAISHTIPARHYITAAAQLRRAGEPPADAGFEPEVVLCKGLDQLFGSEPIAAMRVCTSGNEFRVLQSAQRLFSEGLVGSVAIHQGAGLDELKRIAEFLWRHGFDLEVGGNSVPFGSQASFKEAYLFQEGGFHSVLIGVAREKILS